MKFRKKPVVIDAVQFDGTPAGAFSVFEVFDVPGGKFRPGNSLENGTLLIPTLEGDHTASPGDWLVRGVKGEFYPCKPDIFEMTHEPANDPVPPVSALPTQQEAEPTLSPTSMVIKELLVLHAAVAHEARNPVAGNPRTVAALSALDNALRRRSRLPGERDALLHILAWVRSDATASSFLSLSGYREALIAEVNRALSGATPPPGGTP